MAAWRNTGLVGTREKDDDRGAYLPSPEEIERACAEIRSQWGQERFRRQYVEIREYRVSELMRAVREWM